MGSTFKFKCQGCDYSSNVSGGKDYGYIAIVETKICNSCEEVVDVCIGSTDDCPKEKETIFSDEEMNSCPLCRSKSLSEWKGKCPKCDSQMDKGEIILLWE